MGGKPEPVEPVTFEITGSTISSIRLESEREERSELLALVFDERLADEIGWLLSELPLPDGCAISAKLESVSPDTLEEWIRDSA